MARLIIRGKKNYWRYTITMWCYEIKELVEEELGENVEIIVEDSENDLPQVYLNDVFVLEGVPKEEGYLLELIKKVIDQLKYSQ